MRAIVTAVLTVSTLAAMTGCGASPAGSPLKTSQAQSVDANSKAGLRAALKVYLTQLFQRLDTNNDGRLSRAEALTFFSADEFANLNLNNSPFLTLSEVLNNQAFMTAASAKLHAFAATALAGLDTNKDGKLSWNEYLSSLNANNALSTAEKSYAKLAFDLADRDHDGFLTLDEYEDMVAMANAQAAGTPLTLQDALTKAKDHIQARYGDQPMPMGLTVRWINRAGQFTRDQGDYTFTYWATLPGVQGGYQEVLAVVTQLGTVSSTRDVRGIHTAPTIPAGLDFAKVLSPTAAIETALKAALPNAGDRTSYFVQYQAASTQGPDRIYVDAFQVSAAGDTRLGGLTLNARTGEVLSLSSSGK